MNNKITFIPSRMESRELADYWKDTYTELLSNFTDAQNDKAIAKRNLRKWKFYFGLLVVVIIFENVYLLVN